MVKGNLHNKYFIIYNCTCMVTDHLSFIYSSIYREVVDVIISDRKFDDITYTEDTLSLLVKHMPGI